MRYHIWVSETDKHDRELATIIANTVEDAKRTFAQHYPQDIDNISEIYRDDEFSPIWSK